MGDKEKQDTVEDVITAAWERERKMTERQGTVKVEKTVEFPLYLEDRTHWAC